MAGRLNPRQVSDEEGKTFAAIAGGRGLPKQRVRELWCVIGRRAGKSKMAAALAVYFALFVKHKLSGGGRGMVLVLAMSMEQARVVFDYTMEFLRKSPALSREIANTTRNEIRLHNGIVIAIHSNSFRSVRGRTLCACIFDEVAFWRDDSTATPDAETYTAVLPSHHQRHAGRHQLALSAHGFTGRQAQALFWHRQRRYARGGTMAPVKRETERLAREHWDAIERVAAALIGR